MPVQEHRLPRQQQHRRCSAHLEVDPQKTMTEAVGLGRGQGQLQESPTRSATSWIAAGLVIVREHDGRGAPATASLLFVAKKSISTVVS